MTQPIVKICGITELGSAQVVVDAGADLLGLIFALRSPRRLELSTAQALAKFIHDHNRQVVAVFQDQPVAEVQAIAQALSADYVQLHGSESPQYCQAVGYPIIKALKPVVLDDETVATFSSYQPVVEYFLLDRPTQGQGEGVALPLALSLAKEFAIILAGGLNPSNIGEVSSQTGQYVRGYDVASGVEAAVGIKDPAKVTQFMKVLRS